MLEEADSLQTDILGRILDRLDEARLARLAVALGDLRTAVEALISDDAPGAYHTHQPHGRD
jgi:hypothetical protein